MNADQLSTALYAIATRSAIDVLCEVASPTPGREDAVSCLAGAVRRVAQDPAHVFADDERRAIHAALRNLG